ncbi:DUF4227 family protein [Paenibacillus lignilyticus]|uniref:DUF4227 family protein n=1 Tax=Paenibacillus lignilyticus TaxID=1172615 RepID=A0ABS5CEI1_9BACL|nr:DUF4227 family protein [Paenibacillus lignilyticus]MBP3964399.1 DUF4227 family protein [Paenibacillus lignilyticus]
MVVSVRRWLRRILFVLLLCFLTITMYGGCRFIAVWITPQDPYRVPQGQALKVFNEEPFQVDASSIYDKLRLFYWYGE